MAASREFVSRNAQQVLHDRLAEQRVQNLARSSPEAGREEHLAVHQLPDLFDLAWRQPLQVRQPRMILRPSGRVVHSVGPRSSSSVA